MSIPLARLKIQRLARIPMERWREGDWETFLVIARGLSEGWSGAELTAIVVAVQRRERAKGMLLTIAIIVVSGMVSGLITFLMRGGSR
jgi:hypothetical protein